MANNNDEIQYQMSFKNHSYWEQFKCSELLDIIWRLSKEEHIRDVLGIADMTYKNAVKEINKKSKRKINYINLVM